MAGISAAGTQHSPVTTITVIVAASHLSDWRRQMILWYIISPTGWNVICFDLTYEYLLHQVILWYLQTAISYLIFFVIPFSCFLKLWRRILHKEECQANNRKDSVDTKITGGVEAKKIQFPLIGRQAFLNWIKNTINKKRKIQLYYSSHAHMINQ